MRKRRSPEEDESSSEMEVDDEEKEAFSDSDEDDVDVDGEGKNRLGPAMIENPFLDSFYSLSSENPKERSKAAQVMLEHCLMGSSANSKDAAYTFRRLLNGVCSGRAAARQGNASALSSFLKVACHLKKMEEIREEHGNEVDTKSLSILAYVRHRLMNATDPNQTTGKKKGSEERDYQFGRVFGILSIIRSNILVTEAEENGFEESKEVASALMNDLIGLFWFKRWMREPAAHGVTTLLRSFFDSSSEKKEIAQHLVKSLVVPLLLSKNAAGDDGDSNLSSSVESFCAEQLGVGLFIQSQSIFEKEDLPFPLDRALMTSKTVEKCAQALSETSHVVQPRTHFVWDALWNYLSTPKETKAQKGKYGVEERLLRQKCPASDEHASVVVDHIVQEVVVKRLLFLNSEVNGKATHERRALAMSIIKVLAGVPYASSLSGTVQLKVDGVVLEQSVLTPTIVRALFIEIICAGLGRGKNSGSHLLKPLALGVLNDIAQTSVAEDSPERRLAMAKSFLNCEIRFDARTKTNVVSDILGLLEPVQESKVNSMISFWKGHFENLCNSFLHECSQIKEDDVSSKATGYVELLYTFAKHVLRLSCESSDEKEQLDDFKRNTIEKMLKFFLSVAFFDCRSVVQLENKTPKKKKGKKNKKPEGNSMQETMAMFKTSTNEIPEIAYPVRSVVASRYFSLLSDFVTDASHGIQESTDSKVEKDSITLGILVNVVNNWNALEDLGAKRYAPEANNGDDDVAEPLETIKQMHSLVRKTTEAAVKSAEDSQLSAKKRCSTGMTVLGYTLYIHRLSCGQGSQETEDPDADDENDEEEICNALEGLKDVAEHFVNGNEEENPLLGLTELCANLLSSPLGSGNMGRACSAKLVKEAIKFSWLGGLRLSSELASEDKSLLDTDVVGLLLEAIGIETEKEDAEDDGSENEVSDDEDSSRASMEEDDNVFTKAIDMDDNSDSDDSKDHKIEESEPNNDQVEDLDVKLDSNTLQSMLEEDSDADVGDDILEHHEGADAALAKLIQLRQDSRKAGKQAREKIQMSNYMRCTFLLDLMFNRPDAWSRVLQTEIILEILLPMIQYRRQLERSLKNSLQSSSKGNGSEKQALLDRVTLVYQKVCKTKIQSLPFAKPVPSNIAIEVGEKILSEARRTESKEQSKSCNNAFVFLLKSCSDRSPIGTLLADAVDEWSSKRTTKLQSGLFEDVIAQLPEFSCEVLLPRLSLASQQARSPFLKGECFRILTSLFAIQSKQSIDSSEGFLSAVSVSLKDEEMRKSKRIRIVLKAFEKYLSKVSEASPGTIEVLVSIQKELGLLTDSKSNAVSSICKKLATAIETKKSELNVEDVTAMPNQTKGSKPSKKKNKKKKKR